MIFFVRLRLPKRQHIIACFISENICNMKWFLLEVNQFSILSWFFCSARLITYKSMVPNIRIKIRLYQKISIKFIS